MKSSIVWLLVGLGVIVVLAVFLIIPGGGPQEATAPAVPPAPPVINQEKTAETPSDSGISAPEEAGEGTTTETPATGIDVGEQEQLLPSRFVVRMTDQGFTPQEITIKKGDRVSFENAGNRAHWPASAVHPTHTVYPEGGGCIGSAFDACEGLAPGESWEFTFNQVGRWRYHDHLNPALQGTIIVTQ